VSLFRKPKPSIPETGRTEITSISAIKDEIKTSFSLLKLDYEIVQIEISSIALPDPKARAKKAAAKKQKAEEGLILLKTSKSKISTANNKESGNTKKAGTVKAVPLVNSKSMARDSVGKSSAKKPKPD
jgi:hypothetical protein